MTHDVMRHKNLYEFQKGKYACMVVLHRFLTCTALGELCLSGQLLEGFFPVLIWGVSLTHIYVGQQEENTGFSTRRYISDSSYIADRSLPVAGFVRSSVSLIVRSRPP